MKTSQKPTQIAPSEKPAKRVWRRLPLIDRITLESVANFGLPIDFAGKVIGIQSSNTDRIVKDLRQRREREIEELASKSQVVRDAYLTKLNELQSEGNLKALMIVSNAMAAGRI